MQWDLLSQELEIQELTHIIKGDNPDNRISVLQANVSYNIIYLACLDLHGILLIQPAYLIFVV